jgi:hypothetical protein
LRDDGDGPEKIDGEAELARVRKLALRVLLLAIGTAIVLTLLILTAPPSAARGLGPLAAPS